MDMTVRTDPLAITLLTLKVAAAATLLLLPVGTALGWVLARRAFPGKAALESLLMLPMVLPPVAVGLVLLYLIAPDGPLGRLAAAFGADPLVLTWKAAVLASFVVALPLFVKAAQQAFATVPHRLEQVALSSGHTPLDVFVSVTLPLAARGLINGTLLGFARALGEFGATSLVAGNIPGRTETLALGIYDRIVTGHDRAAWALAGISAALALAAIVAGNLIGRSRP